MISQFRTHIRHKDDPRTRARSSAGIMRTMVGGILAFIGIMSHPLAARADAVLDAWMAEALQSNPEIAAARHRWEAARHEVTRAGSLDEPVLGVTAMRRNSTSVVDYDTLEWMIAQSVPGWGKRRAHTDAAAAEAEAARWAYVETARAIRAQLAAARWKLWAAEKKAELARQAWTYSEQFEKGARARLESGSGTQSDVLRAQIERALLHDLFQTRTDEIRVVSAEINALLNAPPETPRTAGSPAPSRSLLPPFSELVESLKTDNGVLAARSQMIQARAAAQRAARLENRPNWILTAKARQPRGDGIQEYDTGIALTLPWIWRDRVRGRIGEAGAAYEAEKAMFRETLNRFTVRLREEYFQAEVAARRVQLFEDSVLEDSRKLVEARLAEYETAKTSFLEAVESLREYVSVQTSYIEALAVYAQARAQLDQLTGSDDISEFSIAFPSTGGE